MLRLIVLAIAITMALSQGSWAGNWTVISSTGCHISYGDCIGGPNPVNMTYITLNGTTIIQLPWVTGIPQAFPTYDYLFCNQSTNSTYILQCGLGVQGSDYWLQLPGYNGATYGYLNPPGIYYYYLAQGSTPVSLQYCGDSVLFGNQCWCWNGELCTATDYPTNCCDQYTTSPWTGLWTVISSTGCLITYDTCIGGGNQVNVTYYSANSTFTMLLPWVSGLPSSNPTYTLLVCTVNQDFTNILLCGEGKLGTDYSIQLPGYNENTYAYLDPPGDYYYYLAQSSSAVALPYCGTSSISGNQCWCWTGVLCDASTYPTNCCDQTVPVAGNWYVYSSTGCNITTDTCIDSSDPVVIDYFTQNSTFMITIPWITAGSPSETFLLCEINQALESVLRCGDTAPNGDYWLQLPGFNGNSYAFFNPPGIYYYYMSQSTSNVLFDEIMN